MRCFIALLSLLFVANSAFAAEWITAPDAKPPVVLHFRRDVTLVAVPKALWVDVSADNRFILYVNGRRMAEGPATSDLAHWRYARVDLAPYLKRGQNRIAAVAWNFVEPGQDDLSVQTGPLLQQSAGTGFYLAAEDDAYRAFDSGQDWRVHADAGHTALSGMAELNRSAWLGYYVAAAPETIDAATADWGWTTTAAAWPHAVPAGERATSADPLPAMLYKQVASGTGVDGMFPQAPQVIPAHSHVTLLIRRDDMIAAYPALTVTGGHGAVIRMGYAEALYDDKGQRGDRADTAGKHFRGLFDSFTADGRERTFAPLNWRVWRYMQLDITTQDTPLTLKSLAVNETRYPFVAKGGFQSDDPELNHIWQIGWATATLDAHETYMDSAYWERLQYVGDTRLQMLISYAVSGDARLAQNAIDAFGWSDTEGGLTEGAYPSRGHNPIAPFSLLWIGQMHDWWMQQPDTAVLTRNLPRMRRVLAWFGPYMQEDGLLRQNPTWNFVDWVGKPREAFPSFDAGGESCLTSLIYLGALEQAADLEHALGERTRGDDDARETEEIKTGVRTKCWDESRGLFADDPSKTLFSQHTNALAVLYDVVPADQGRDILARVIDHDITPPEGIIPVSYYFSWYLARALEHSGMADHYAGLMQAWRNLLPLHVVTWPEAQLEPRSDTHAWSAHPTADLLAVVAGIEPAAPGYAAVRIAPHLGGLKQLTATAMTPQGPVTVVYAVDGGTLSAIIRKPAGLPGTFAWGGKSYALKGAETKLSVAE